MPGIRLETWFWAAKMSGFAPHNAPDTDDTLAGLIFYGRALPGAPMSLKTAVLSFFATSLSLAVLLVFGMKIYAATVITPDPKWETDTVSFSFDASPLPPPAPDTPETLARKKEIRKRIEQEEALRRQRVLTWKQELKREALREQLYQREQLQRLGIKPPDAEETFGDISEARLAAQTRAEAPGDAEIRATHHQKPGARELENQRRLERNQQRIERYKQSAQIDLPSER
ncbi:hypothetical protein DL240_14125 [Lujinxingia litoralis]|uniref:Uncharacterized protein n=1 Tax=Lujinxingia litoralis TaxID=2211119 RepID=A0A328C928_9DELT|nr:hypothetical protein [Lujinxingia litoralis]RAL21259.1 hypothetical protein DL240_14125 [Lujinxingia litoralis]